MMDLLGEIEKTGAEELDTILKAVLSRYCVLFPDWEISTVSVLKSEKRKEQLDRMITVLEKMKNLPNR